MTYTSASHQRAIGMFLLHFFFRRGHVHLCTQSGLNQGTIGWALSTHPWDLVEKEKSREKDTECPLYYTCSTCIKLVPV